MHRNLILAVILLMIISCLFAGCLVQPAPTESRNASILMYTEDLPPFNYRDASGSVTGSSTEVVLEILSRLGQKADIELVPWSTGYNLTLTTPDTALYSTARNGGREGLFSWVGPIGSIDYVFYARNDSGIPVISLESVKKAGKVAVVRNDARHQYLVSENVTALSLYPDDESCLRALLAGDCALWLASNTAPSIIARSGIDPATVMPVYTASSTELFIAFNNRTSPSTIKEWQDTLDAMKGDGTYAAIMARYNGTSPGAQQAAAAADTRSLLPALMALTDLRFSDLASSLEVLALTGEARSGEWEQIRPLLVALEERNSGARLWYALPDGSYYTTVDNLTTANLASRPYFPGVLAGNTSIGYIVVSHSTGRTTGIVAVPIRRDGNVSGVFGASLYLDTLSDELGKELGLSQGMYFFSLDREGTYALNSRTSRIGQKPAVQGTPAETRAFAEILGRDSGEVSFKSEGKTNTVVFRASPVTGWKFGIGIER